MPSSDALAPGSRTWKVSLQRSGTAAETALQRHVAPGVVVLDPSTHVVVQPSPPVFEQDYYLLLWQPGTPPESAVRIAPDLVHLVSVVQRPEYPVRALLRMTRAPIWAAASGDPELPEPRVSSVAELEHLLAVPDDTNWLKDLPAGAVDRPTTTVTSTAFADVPSYSFSICDWIKICDPQPPA